MCPLTDIVLSLTLSFSSSFSSLAFPLIFAIGIARSQEGYVAASFETISASGPNGAIIHYKPTNETNRPLSKNEMYLLDSGAQYYDGTTDVTRTVHFGVPSQHQKECFTRVVKGHIGLASVIFPNKLKGSLLDTLARKSLVSWYF